MSNEQKRTFILTYLVFFMNGMLALSIGSLLPFIRDARGLDYTFCGMIVSLHSVGNLISSFAAGALPLAIGRRKSILLFEIFFPVSYVILLTADSRVLIAFAFLATGLARGACSNYCNTRINAIATGKAWALNTLHACFAVGAFAFPLILLAITNAGEERWVIACGVMMILGCITWLLYFLMPEMEEDKKKERTDREETSAESSDQKKEQRTEGRNSFGFFREPIFWLCLSTLFFYLCAEQGVIGWMITYFKDTGLIAAQLSQTTASILWVMILCGRLTVAFLSTRMPKENLLPFMGLGIVGFFVLLILANSPVLIFLGIMGFGFSMAGIYATTVSFAGNLIKKYSLAWSFLLTGASLGSILMPSIVGNIAEHAGIAVGMSSIALVLIVDMVCIFLLVRHVKRTRNA